MTRRLMVDAMNVIGSRPDRWWNHPKRAMRDLAVRLDRYAADTGDTVTVVFDKDPGPLPPLQIDVVTASRRGRDAADHEIEQIVAAADDLSELTVVTSDKRLAERVRALGARTTGAGAFRKSLDAYAE